MPKRAGAGRPKGALNKTTADVKALAQEFGPAAVRQCAKLAGLMPGGVGKAESEAAQMMALKEVLDRAYGKPRQEIEHSGSIGRPVKEMSEEELLERISSLRAGIAGRIAGEEAGPSKPH